tara:strand:+ start:7772 stop:11278 length:3507 start_codon:yes stop_codon:yes gene_type:complete
MSPMSRVVAIAIIALMASSIVPLANAASGRAVNVDLDVKDISITYPDSTNQSLYQMFSSNYPIPNFDKPEMLYVTDGVVGVEMNINIAIENLGTVQSGFIDVEVLVLHNEYTRFELLNTTQGMSPLSGSSSGSVDILWTPTYSGNHTLAISVSNTVGDDDQSNNEQSRHLTVAYHYDNCNDMSQWTVTGEWNVNSDVYISQSQAFHVGNGQFSTYSPNTVSTLTSPFFNVADDVSNPNSAIGYSLFYTGGAGAGDQLKGYIKDDTGTWDETFTLQNVVDNNFADGLSWNTFSAQYNGKNSPLLPVQNKHFHTTTQLRFTFSSDASGNDIGYWMDELIIIYDQAAQKKEFQVQTNGVSTIGGLPGDWSTARIEMTNTGNISARYTPTADGIPSNWTHYFAYTNGASIGSSGIELLPGETRIFDLRVLVDENASQGNIPVTVNVTSNIYNDIQSSTQSIIKILPDRLPDIILPEYTPRCPPGSTCNFPIMIENIGEATDVFSLSMADKNIPNGWNIEFAWNQTNEILVRVDTPRAIWLEVTVPSGIEPDLTAEVWLTATSTNDTRRYDTKVIEVAAAMISNAEVSLDSYSIGEHFIDPGDSHEVTFRIWNNASRIDIFQPQIDFTEITGWQVELLNSPELAISSGSSTTYTVKITAPINAQAGDYGPMIYPKALSMRSGELVVGDSWQELRVNSIQELSISLIDSPVTLTPGIPMQIAVEVINDGNGPTMAMLDLPWSPESWDWWALDDGVNVTEGIPLSVSYDLDNIKQVDLWLLLPSLEAPGEFHEITISVNSNDGEDVNISDNSVMFEAITETIRQPRLDGYAGESVIETNSIYTFNATAWNIGNAADTNIRARLVIQSSQDSDEVIGFLSTNTGLSKQDGEWMNLNLGPTESIELLGEIIVSPDCSLNTIISATIELEGGMDELGRPILKTVSAALIVGERRNVELQDIEPIQGDLPEKSPRIMWVNLSSTSTQGEIFDVGADVPEGWGMICDGYTIHLDDTKIEMDAGHLTVQKYDMRCEVLRENGDYSGEITVFINGSDSRITYQYTEKLTWKKSPANEELSGTIIASGAGGLILLVLLILVFIRRRDADDEDYIEDEYDEQDVPIAGPPATAFAGPPATTISSPSPMEEYQKQLDEYNRKMAEYQAWQDTQGSQVTNDSTHHE